MNNKKKRDRQTELEKGLILNPEKIEKNKRKKQQKRSLILLGSLVAVVCILGISFQAVKAIGKSSLKSRQAVIVPLMETEAMKEALSEEEKSEWQSGWVKYKGEIYAYNEDIMTFLFMGIDKSKEVKETAEGTDGGQADALFLLVMNPHNKSIRIIGINRNTMTDIDLYDDKGAYIKTVTAQIAVQHGFGNGLEKSCEYQVDAVQKLFYNLPVHGYCAVNMGAVIPLTDLVGGIELVSKEDVRTTLTDEDRNSLVAKKGESILLDGRKAYSYVSYRDTRIEGSADSRLERQKQYLTEFIKKTKSAMASDATLPVKLYNSVTSQMVTDVSVDELTYLVSVAKDFDFGGDSFYSLKGETKQGEQFEEYYVDETALYEMILDIFYEPIKSERTDEE